MNAPKYRTCTAHYLCGCPQLVETFSPEQEAADVARIERSRCSQHKTEADWSKIKRDWNRIWGGAEFGFRCERHCSQGVGYQEGLSSRELHDEILCEFHRVEKAARAQLLLLEVA